MTEERAEKNKIYSERLNNIVRWSLENKKLWRTLSSFDDSNITIEELEILLEETVFHGYMELYYLLLTRIAEMLSVNINSTKFASFLKSYLDKDLSLDDILDNTFEYSNSYD